MTSWIKPEKLAELSPNSPKAAKSGLIRLLQVDFDLNGFQKNGGFD